MSEIRTIKSTLNRLSSFSLCSQTPEPEFLCPISEDRSQYLSDNKCFNCSTNFNVPGLAHTKKQFCRFCYRGICSRCLDSVYFHQESNDNQPICNHCIQKVIAMSLNQQNEIQKYRLEKLELLKEIQLAIDQKEQTTKERKIIESDLNAAKVMLELDLQEIDDKKEELRAKFAKNLEKVESLDLDIQKKESEFKGLKERFVKKAEKIRLKKERIEMEERERGKVKGELAYFVGQIGIFKRNIEDEGEAEEVIVERIEVLVSEITEIQERYEEVINRTEEVRRIQSNVNKEREKNQELIDCLNEKLEYLKLPSEEDELTQAEHDRLTELKKQIKDLDEIIKLKELRKTRHFSMYKKDHSHAKIPFTNYSEVPLDISQNEEPAKTQKGNCCRTCSII